MTGRADQRDVLDAERQRIVEALGRLRADFGGIVAGLRDSNADDEHDPEGHTIAYERSQVDALIRSAEGRLAEVEAALERWDEGRYGVCERCGGQIPAGRLEARPTARHCVACALSSSR